MGFFISKSQISVLKKIPPKWDGNVLTCNQKSIFFNEKDYLNLFLSKYSIPAKRNKLPHITNLETCGGEEMIRPTWYTFLGVSAWNFTRNLTGIMFT